MQITIRNKANLANKYIRLIKWRLFKAKEKFNHLIYAEVHLKSEGKRPTLFIVNVRLGIPGNDIIIEHQSSDLKLLFKKSSAAVQRYLRKTKSIKLMKTRV